MFYKKIYNFGDRLEDKARGRLSHYPIIYAFIGGTGIIRSRRQHDERQPAPAALVGRPFVHAGWSRLALNRGFVRF